MIIGVCKRIITYLILRKNIKNATTIFLKFGPIGVIGKKYAKE